MSGIPFHVTERDQEVLNLVMAGCQSSEIAKELHISPRTVKAHMSRIYLRAGMDSRSKGKKIRLLNLLPDTGSAQPLAHRPKITPRNMEIIVLVAQGLTNIEIASRSGGTEWTVRNHLCRIFDACGVWSREELAVWWRAHGREFQQVSQ